MQSAHSSFIKSNKIYILLVKQLNQLAAMVDVKDPIKSHRRNVANVNVTCRTSHLVFQLAHLRVDGDECYEIYNIFFQRIFALRLHAHTCTLTPKRKTYKNFPSTVEWPNRWAEVENSLVMHAFTSAL